MEKAKAKPTGIVLCGGQSRRLGRDKASELVAGRPLIEAATHVLGGVAGEIVLVLAPDQPTYPLAPAMRVVRDPILGRGPLVGLIAGLEAAASTPSWVVACDMPFLDPYCLEELMTQTAGFDAGVARVAGCMQPFPGVYSRSCLPLLRRLLGAGHPRDPGFQDLLHLARTRVLEVDDGDRADVWRRCCFSVNTEEDLARARRIASGE